MAKLPRTFLYCIRCDKEINPHVETHLHTCTPSAKYRAGMEEMRKELQPKLAKCVEFIKKISTQKWLDESKESDAYAEIGFLTDMADELLKELEVE